MQHYHCYWKTETSRDTWNADTLTLISPPPKQKKSTQSLHACEASGFRQNSVFCQRPTFTRPFPPPGTTLPPRDELPF